MFCIQFQGGTGQERALFMRLHLLQGILAIHKTEKVTAKALLEKVRVDAG